MHEQATCYSNDSSNDEPREREFINIKTRLMTLQYRASHLEHDLKGINASLFSLDKQMQRNEAYKKTT